MILSRSTPSLNETTMSLSKWRVNVNGMTQSLSIHTPGRSRRGSGRAYPTLSRNKVRAVCRRLHPGINARATTETKSLLKEARSASGAGFTRLLRIVARPFMAGQGRGRSN